MTIKKFQGKTEEEATAKAIEELGTGAVIMNVKEIKPKGLLRFFKESSFEVTAAVEEAETIKTVASSPVRTVTPAPAPAPSPSAAIPSATPTPPPGNINVAADEPISIPKPESIKEVFASVENTWASSVPQGQREEYKKDNYAENNLEEKIESLQSLLEKKLVQPSEVQKGELPKEAPMDENLKFIKMIYGILLENEVDEKYVNQIMDEVEKVMKSGISVENDP